MRHNEREKNVLVDELASQNARLTQQLQAANELEVQLNNKLQELKSQYNIQHQTLQVSDTTTLIHATHTTTTSTKKRWQQKL